MTGPSSGIVDGRLSRVVLDGDIPSTLPSALEADRAQAVTDLAVDSHFMPLTLKPGVAARGPFVLHLALQDGRLVFDIRRGNGARLAVIGLALGPFRGLMKDYQLLVDSHGKAVEEGRVHLPREASWLPAYESELLAFPTGRHDDQVDSTSQALHWLTARTPVRRERPKSRPRPPGRARPPRR